MRTFELEAWPVYPMQSFILFLLAVTIPLTEGCYSFQPVDRSSPPPPGTTVRAEMEERPPAGIVGGRDALRAGEPGQRFRGNLLSWTGDTLAISVLAPGPLSQLDTLRVASRNLASVETMHFDAGKTALVIGGGGLVVGLYVFTQFSSAGGSPAPGEGPRDVGGFRVPLFHFAVPH